MITESLMTEKHVKNAHMGSHLLIEVYNVTFDKLNDAKKRKASVKKNFDMINLSGGSWTIEVPLRKKVQ